MGKIGRAIIAIFCLLLTLSAVFLGFFGLFGHDNSGNHMYGLGVVGFVMAAILGIFNYHDYQYFFGSKNDTTTKTQV